MKLSVAFTPASVGQMAPEKKVCLVIDVLRATTTLAAMLEGGARDILLETTPDRARAASAGRLLCGEDGGQKPDDFDFGNSPAQYLTASIGDRGIVFSTTNGTKALQIARLAPYVIAASLRNGSAAVEKSFAIARSRDLDLLVVCSGRAEGRDISLDDSLTAGFLVSLFAARFGFTPRKAGILPQEPLARSDDEPADERGRETEVHSSPVERMMLDSATVALGLYHGYLARGGSPDGAALIAFNEATSGGVLTNELRLAEDVRFCAQTDRTRKVPRAILDGDSIRVVPAD